MKQTKGPSHERPTHKDRTHTMTPSTALKLIKTTRDFLGGWAFNWVGRGVDGTQGLCSNSAHLWQGNVATSDFVPFSGVPGEHKGFVTSDFVPFSKFRQLVGPQDGNGDVATADFVPFFWRPQRMQGLRSNSAHSLAPEKAGVMWPLLILSPLLGTPENARVM